MQRRYLQEIQAFQEPEISRQLEDFRSGGRISGVGGVSVGEGTRRLTPPRPSGRSKRLMGMTPGEQELAELESYRTRDQGIREAKEKQLAELLLARLEEMQ